MSIEFLIGTENKPSEPTIGAWYTAMYNTCDGAISDGVVGQYLGNGEFCDEDGDDVTICLGSADFLNKEF